MMHTAVKQCINKPTPNDSVASAYWCYLWCLHCIYFLFSKVKHRLKSSPPPPEYTATPFAPPPIQTGKMATAVLRFSRQLAKKHIGLLGREKCSQTSNLSKAAPCRTAVTTTSGAILPKPDKVSILRRTLS